mmetsp:Transcript_30597/g.67604  ORF Transcript_30597/g.67604 Transcript_30597/m.67604 type:complete len:243 (-) Transcript_30597:424-1152(-)
MVSAWNCCMPTMARTPCSVIIVSARVTWTPESTVRIKNIFPPQLLLMVTVSEQSATSMSSICMSIVSLSCSTFSSFIFSMRFLNRSRFFLFAVKPLLLLLVNTLFMLSYILATRSLSRPCSCPLSSSLTPATNLSKSNSTATCGTSSTSSPASSASSATLSISDASSWASPPELPSSPRNAASEATMETLRTCGITSSSPLALRFAYSPFSPLSGCSNRLDFSPCGLSTTRGCTTGAAVLSK